MAITINKDLLPLKVHYFFKYGGIAFFSLLPVVCRQKGIPAVGLGLMWSVTPLSSCAINLMNSAIADTFKIYRAMFLSGLMVLSVSFVSIFLLPDFARHSGGFTNRAVEPFSRCYTYESAVEGLEAIDWSVYQGCGNWTGFDWMKGNDGDGYCVLDCKYPLLAQDMFNQSVKFYGPDHLNRSWSVSGSGLYDICDSDHWTAITDSNTSTDSVNGSCQNEYTDVPCFSVCETFEAHHHPPTMTLTQLLQTPIFWLVFFLLMLVYGGNSTSTTMADTICFSLLGSARHKYGRQRMWGSLGWGMVGTVSGALVDLFSKGKGAADYTPAVIIAAGFLGINFLVATKIPFKLPDREKLKASRVGRALCSSRMVIYMTMVVVLGVNMGMYWTFLFIYVEDIASAWDPDFEYMKLLQGLMLGTACFLGEVPSLFLSPIIVKKLGHIKTFALALFGFTIRMFLYSSVVNPWFFIPIELSHGLSFGVFYPNMISYASLMSPKGAQATIQGIVKSLFVVGVSLGGLVGGFLMANVGGSRTYLYLGEFDIAFTVFFCAVQFAIHKMEVKDGLGEYASTPDGGPNGDLGKLKKKRGLAADLAVEEQGSMCDLQVITPYPEITVEEEEEKLKEEMVA